MQRIPLEQQIAEVAREVSLRVAFYPRLIPVGTVVRRRAARAHARGAENPQAPAPQAVQANVRVP